MYFVNKKIPSFILWFYHIQNLEFTCFHVKIYYTLQIHSVALWLEHQPHYEGL